MRSYFVFALLLFFSISNGYAAAPEKRCGWYENPAPGYAVLRDKDGAWILQTQLGYESKGDWMPAFKPDQFVSTNGDYGYGCVCMSVLIDHKKQLVTDVKSTTIRPLETCRADKTLWHADRSDISKLKYQSAPDITHGEVKTPDKANQNYNN